MLAVLAGSVSHLSGALKSDDTRLICSDSATAAPLPTPSTAAAAPDNAIADLQLGMQGLAEVVQTLKARIDTMEQLHAAEINDLKDIVTCLANKLDPEK